MRVTLRLSGAAVLLSLACASAGCGGSSAQPGNAPDATTDSAVETGGSACYVDASLAVFAASDAAAAGCAACVEGRCAAAVAACATNCRCIDFFTCLADAGVATSGLGPQTTTAANACAGVDGLKLFTNPGISSLVTCLSSTCAPACSQDAGADSASPSQEGG